jgi:microcystin degradation protein MlrC
VDAYVKAITDGKFTYSGPMSRGLAMNLGPMVRLVVPSQDGDLDPAAAARRGLGVDVILGSVRTQTLDEEIFLLHGIDVRRYKIVALKSSNHFRAAFEPLARAIVTADGPGLSSRDLSRFPFRRLKRPIWPLDPM